MNCHTTLVVIVVVGVVVITVVNVAANIIPLSLITVLCFCATADVIFRVVVVVVDVVVVELSAMMTW